MTTLSQRCNGKHVAQRQASTSALWPSMSLNRLYPTHMPLGLLPKTMLAAGASLGALLWPQRADLVAAVGELTGESAFQAMHKRMSHDATGQLLLQQKPLITVCS